MREDVGGKLEGTESSLGMRLRAQRLVIKPFLDGSPASIHINPPVLLAVAVGRR